ncbi:hypothetical protein NKH69_19775 [Mesorhizobium sp. M0976]|uniref:hypothetical protein n=1 Tax=unclassified Mesorhizobium TaxID=325217 RepID=UPI0033389FA7
MIEYSKRIAHRGTLSYIIIDVTPRAAEDALGSWFLAFFAKIFDRMDLALVEPEGMSALIDHKGYRRTPANAKL